MILRMAAKRTDDTRYGKCYSKNDLFCFFLHPDRYVCLSLCGNQYECMKLYEFRSEQNVLI